MSEFRSHIQGLSPLDLGRGGGGFEFLDLSFLGLSFPDLGVRVFGSEFS